MTSTPEEKANELIELFLPLVKFGYRKGTQFKNAKQCALIAVELAMNIRLSNNQEILYEPSLMRGAIVNQM